MKKVFKNLSLPLCAVLALAGCSCNKKSDDSVKADINGGKTQLVTGAKDDAKVYNLQDVYDALKNSAANEVVADKLIEILGDVVLFDIEDEEEKQLWQYRYDEKIKERLIKLTEDPNYQKNGEFDEELLKIKLDSKLYTVTCTPSVDGTPSVEKLTCDYTTYINKYLKLEVIEELLKEKYVYDKVLEDKKTIFSSKKVRFVEYVSIDSTHEDALDFIHEKVGELAAENSSVTLATIAEEWEAKLLADLETKKLEIGTNQDANGSITKDFTNGYMYSVEEGYGIKKKAIEDVDYLNSSVITTDNKDILNSSLVSRILSDNIIVEEGTTNKSYEINGNHYVVNPLADSNINERDIVIKDTTNSKYYLIRVEVVTKDSTNAYDGVKVLATNNTLVSDYLNYYLDQNKELISVHDTEVYEYLKTLYPTIFVD